MSPFSLIAALLLAGCGGKSKACNELVGTINAHQPELSRAREALIEPSPATKQQFEQAIAEAQKALEALKFEDPRLQELTRRYRGLLDEASDVGRRYTQLPEDPAARARVFEDAEAVVRLENDLVAAINTYCSVDD